MIRVLQICYIIESGISWIGKKVKTLHIRYMLCARYMHVYLLRIIE